MEQTHTHSLYRIPRAATPRGIIRLCLLCFPCAGVSPVELSALRPGPHLLIIMHGKDECEYRRQLLIRFDIENTPDNPHNNI